MSDLARRRRQSSWRRWSWPFVDVARATLPNCQPNPSWRNDGLVRAIVADRESYPTRAAISRALCHALSWRKPDGGLKEVS